jgi:hypothetical protein
VTILATEEGVSFIPYRGSRVPRSITYETLLSASARSFLGRKSIIFHEIDGVEAVRCIAKHHELREFCHFINSRIAANNKKPIAARFKLTQLEAPPDSIFANGMHRSDKFEAALESLFNPVSLTDVLFDELDNNVDIADHEIPSAAASKQERLEKPIGARFNLTRIEIPPKSTFATEAIRSDQYGSAIDLIFNPLNLADLLEELGNNVDLTNHKTPRSAVASKRQKKVETSLPNARTNRPPIFGRRVDAQRKANRAKRNWLVLPLIFIPGFSGLWWVATFVPAETTIEEGAETARRPEPSKPANEARQDHLDPRTEQHHLKPRTAERLLQIMQNDSEYTRLMAIFREHRAAMGLSIDQASGLVGWTESDLVDVESAAVRPNVLGLVHLALAIKLNIHDAIERVK